MESSELWIEIESWLGIEWLEQTHSPRHAVQLELSREGLRHQVTLPAKQWDLPVRPPLRPELPLAQLLDPARPAAERARELGRWIDKASAEAATVRAWLVLERAKALIGADRVSEALDSVTGVASLLSGRTRSVYLERASAAFGVLDQTAAALQLIEVARDVSVSGSVEERALWKARLRGSRAWLLAQSGELDEAEVELEAALAKQQTHAPESWVVAATLGDLGTIAGRRNDLARAEWAFLRALSIRRALGERSVSLLNNLGIVAHLRGDYERAAQNFDEVVEQRRALEEEPSLIAGALMNLANALSADGQRELALERYAEAEQLIRESTPQSMTRARILGNRARLLLEIGELEASEAEARRALSLVLELSPGGSDEAAQRADLGVIALERGEISEAVRELGKAYAIRRSRFPGSTQLALVTSRLAEAAEAAGNAARADELHVEAVGVVEEQQKRIGGVARGWLSFRDRVYGIYRAAIEHWLDRGSTRQAFELYESSRARALRALLNQQGVEASELVRRAPGGESLFEQRQSLDYQIEQRYRELSDHPVGSSERSRLGQELAALQLERERLTGLLHLAEPRLRRFEAPPELDLGSIVQRLGDREILLAYFLGERQSWVFAVTADELRAAPLSLTDEELGRLTSDWVDALARGREGPRVEALGERIARTLLEPVADDLSSAEAVVWIADEALANLPIGALLVPRDPAGQAHGSEPRRLVQRFELRTGTSASMALRAPPPTSRQGHSVVFAEPQVADDARGLRSRLGQLSSTRLEAAAVVGSLGPSTRIYRGAAASESRFWQELPEAEVLHFAGHALVDPNLPLDSALALAGGEGEGLIRAGELVERGDTRASLVVLSGCSSALGRPYRGEGLVGLSFAFQAIGARSVLASLWPIRDESTAALMSRFYQYRGEGSSDAEALRRAQEDLATGPVQVERDGDVVTLDLTHPRHWAGFLLSGG